MNAGEVTKVLKRYYLKPASKRDLSLFTFSCIARAYVIFLKKKMGISYNTVAALGNRGGFVSFFNEEHIARETEKYLRKNFKKISNILGSAEDISKIEYRKIVEANNKKNPRKFLVVISDSYPKYFLSVALINCFWRYLGNESNQGKLTPYLVKSLSAKRKKIVQIYPRIEKLIAKNCDRFGRENNISGQLLKFLTANELKVELRENRLHKKKLIETKTRMKGYVYLFLNNKEYVTTEIKTIKKIKEFNFKFFKKTKEINLIKGYVAYPGIIKGIV